MSPMNPRPSCKQRKPQVTLQNIETATRQHDSKSANNRADIHGHL